MTRRKGNFRYSPSGNITKGARVARTGGASPRAQSTWLHGGEAAKAARMSPT
jgi:hypothetical protein